MSGNPRLDQHLVSSGHYETRARARDAIKRGCVLVDGKAAKKPGAPLPPDAEVSVADDAQHYVSRAALKLKRGLDLFGIDPQGKTALDLGASTGGFTQVLLERGAARVFAIDVGHGQLSSQVAKDERVTSMEKRNARDVTAEHLRGAAPQLVVSDMSFISLKLAAAPALKLAAAGAQCVLLVKPQFEVGRDKIGKNGLVAAADADACAHDLRTWLDSQPEWRSIGFEASPITGGDGNREFLLAGAKDG